MLKKVTQKAREVRRSRRQQFAQFKTQVRVARDKKFPKLRPDIEEAPVVTVSVPQEPQKDRSTQRMITFRGVGLGFAVLGYLLYHTLAYVYMLIAACIISLALEGVITFRSRRTRSRGVGILITYLLTLLFVLSGFLIIVPFLLSRGTQMLQSVIFFAQGVQADILEQGINAYISNIHRIPGFMKGEILDYITTTNATSFMQTLTDNLGNIVNLSSSYLKTIWSYAVNFFWGIFGAAGKFIILFTLSVFFSISHFEVKYMIKHLLRKVKHSQERVEEVYGDVASRLKYQLLLCAFIGVASYIGLRFLSLIGFDLPQKGVLALLAGLFEIIPYLGPILWGVPAAIFGLLLYGFPGLFMVIIIYVVIQQVEEKILVPVLMSKTLWINPLLVFVSMLFGGLIMGVFGVVLAVPIAVILSIACRLPMPANKRMSPIKPPLPKQKLSPKPKKAPLKTKK